MAVVHSEAAAPADTAMRERILGAAFAAFMQQGYAGTSTLDIARRAKVSKRDLYAHFGSKQAMLEACIASRAERMRLPLALPAPRKPDELVATLMTFGTTLLREASRPEVLAVFRLAITEAAHSPDVARTLDAVGRAPTQLALARLFWQAQKAGLLGPGKTDEMLETFTGILWGGGLQTRLLLGTVAPPGPRECERRARAATDALLRLYPVGPRTRPRPSATDRCDA